MNNSLLLFFLYSSFFGLIKGMEKYQIPIYSANSLSSIYHVSQERSSFLISCSGIFYEDDNTIILETEDREKSFIIICAEQAVNNSHNKNNLIQKIVSKNNGPIECIITCTPMGRCTSLFFEEAVFNKSSDEHKDGYKKVCYVILSNKSENGKNFLFKVSNFKVIESTFQSKCIKKMQLFIIAVFKWGCVMGFLYVFLKLFFPSIR